MSNLIPHVNKFTRFRVDSVYIGPNESREIINRGHDVCTIAVAVAPVK